MSRTIDASLIPPQPDLRFEQALWERGISHIGGIDEAGRGALAGPVAAAVVVLPSDPGIQKRLDGVRDSKQMTSAQRDRWREIIEQEALSWQVGYASPGEIDHLGIVPAIRLAAARALKQLSPFPHHLLLDYLQLPDCPLPQTWMKKGDLRSLSIAAASVLAKTHRDEHLKALDRKFPDYKFANNKGYGTAQHREAIQEFGPCSLHRMTFAPMRYNTS